MDDLIEFVTTWVRLVAMMGFVVGIVLTAGLAIIVPALVWGPIGFLVSLMIVGCGVVAFDSVYGQR